MRRTGRFVVGIVGATLLLGAAPSGASATESLVLPAVGGYLFREGQSSVEATFVVPRWRCQAADEGLTSLVIANRRRTQTGGAGVEASCIDGRKVFRAAFMTPAGGVDPIDGRVRGGDEITVSISLQSEDLVINLVNETRGWGVGSAQPDAGGDIAMVAVGDARLTVDGELLAVPAFGRHVFSAIALDGSPPDADLAFWMPLVEGDGSYLIRPTRLRDDPTTFTDHSMT